MDLPPPYNSLIDVEETNEPPKYFDVSVVPGTAVVLRSEVPPELLARVSKATTDVRSGGVITHDKEIESNPDELWLYFLTYLRDEPEYGIVISGNHFETRTMHKSDGQVETHTESVTDFNITLLLDNYISKHWHQVYTTGSEYTTIRDALEAYTLTDKEMKQISLTKVPPGWNVDQLMNNLTYLVRSTGYSDNLTVSMQPISKYKIRAHSSSFWMKLNDNPWAKILCFLSCLWIIFLPMFYLVTTRVRKTIYASYPMIHKESAFYSRNADRIVRLVHQRTYAREDAFDLLETLKMFVQIQLRINKGQQPRVFVLEHVSPMSRLWRNAITSYDSAMEQ